MNGRRDYGGRNNYQDQGDQGGSKDYGREREEVYSERVRAGKRTYFFDVRATRSDDYYITITESKRRFDGRGYDKHKVFLYKEDFNKFVTALNKAVDHVKTELMPDYDYEEFDRKHAERERMRNEEGGNEEGGYDVDTDSEGTETPTAEEETLSTSWGEDEES